MSSRLLKRAQASSRPIVKTRPSGNDLILFGEHAGQRPARHLRRADRRPHQDATGLSVRRRLPRRTSSSGRSLSGRRSSPTSKTPRTAAAAAGSIAA